MEPTKKVIAVSAEQMRQIDERAVHEFKIPVLTLMEHAGKVVTRECLKTIRGIRIAKPKVLVLCGGGNNAGDGLVVARRLYLAKISVSAILLKPADSFKDAVLANFNEIVRLGLPYEEDPKFLAIKKKIEENHIVVDAIVGTGLKREITGLMKETIQALNASGKVVISVDIPSGLDADTAEIHGVCVRADVTVTMGALKIGFLKEKARPWTGKIVVADIGFPKKLFD